MTSRIEKLRTAIFDVVSPVARNNHEFNLRALLKAKSSLARIRWKVPDASLAEVIELGEREWSEWLRTSAIERRLIEEEEDET